MINIRYSYIGIFIPLLLMCGSILAKDNKTIPGNGTITVWEGVNVKGNVCINTSVYTVDIWFINSGTTWPTKSITGEHCEEVRKTVKSELRVRNKSATAITIQVWDDVKGGGAVDAAVGAADAALGGKNSEARKILRAFDPSTW